MKISKALSIIKKSTAIMAFQDLENGVQLLSNGVAAYDISSLPKVETTSELAGMLGIDNEDKHYLSIQPIPDTLSEIDHSRSMPVDILGIGLSFGDDDFTLVKANERYYAFNAKYFKPIENEDLLYILPNGMLLVGGLTITGYIMPYSIAGDTMGMIKDIADKGLWRNRDET